MDSRAVVVSDDEDLLGNAVVTDALLALGSTTGLEIRPACANYIKIIFNTETVRCPIIGQMKLRVTTTIIQDG